MNNDERIKNALEIAVSCSQIDGAHHKAWAIDQMVRALTGCSFDTEWSYCKETNSEYAEFIKKYCEEDGDPEAYSWEEGIAP